MSPAPSPLRQSRDRLCGFNSRRNLRSAIRYALQADVVVSWVEEDGVAHQSRGYTRDISPGGAYIFASTFPSAGHRVQVSIQLPMFAADARVSCVIVKGRVLRAEKPPLAADSGFSVRSEAVMVCTI